MSRSIDERIVEMKFNNKDFERNAAETMSTLEKLKAKLKFDGATKGIEEIERAGRKFSLDGMGSATDVVVKKFDFMATAAFTAINRIVDKAMDAGEKLIKSLSLDQVTAGWEKYNSKVASVQTIVNATGLSTETIERYLSKLMWYSDETSYSFSEMVSALGQMTSAGGDINKLIPMIMGIANAAAYAGKIGEPFVHAIRNINQSYSMGYLNLQDWKSVELAGVNSKALMETLIKYGKELGTITADMGEITAENFRNSLKDKWATKEVMEAAFGEFASMTEEAYKMVQSGEVDTASEAYSKLAGQYGEIAERAALAAQEAKTFEEAIDATKDAVSTKWLNIFDTIIGSYDEAKRLWTDFANDLWDVFAGPMDDKQATLDQGLTSGFTRFVREKQLNTELLVEEVLKQIDKSDREAIEKAATGDYGIIDTLEGVGNRAGKIRQTIADYGLGEAFKDGALSAELLVTSVHNVRTELDGMVQEWTASGYDIEQEVKDYYAGFVALDDAIINGTIDGEELKTILADINRESGRANLVDALKSGWQALFRAREDEEGNIIGATGLITVFKKALADLFPPATSEQIYAFTERIKNFAESLILTKDQAKGLRNIIRGFLQPLRWAADGIKTIWGWMKSIFDWGNGKLRKAFEWFSDVENIGDFIHKIFGDERYVRLTAAWNTISEKLGNAWKTISDALGRIFGKDKETSKFLSLWQKIKDAMGVVAGWILDRIVDLVELIASINFEQIADDLASYFETAWAWLKTSYANVKAYVEGLHLDQVAANVWKWIVEAYGSVKNFIENFSLDSLIQTFKDAWTAIKNFFSGKNPDGSGQLSAEKSWLAQQLDLLKAGWEKIAPTVQPILDYVASIFDQFVKHITPGNVAIILFGYSVIRMVKAITAAATGVANIGSGFANIAKGLKSMFKGMGARLRPNYIRELSIAIGMMTAAISVFFMLMKDPTRLREASILLGTIATVFVGLVGALAAISKAMIGGDKEDKTMSRLSRLMLTFSASLILLAASVSIISGINLEGIWERLGIFALTLGAFVGSIILLSKFVPQVSKGMHGLLFMAGSIYVLTFVVKKLTDIPINDILDALPKFLILIGMLFLLAKAITGSSSKSFSHIKGSGTKYSSSTNGPSMGAAAGMLVMVLDLLVLCKVLRSLAKEPVGELIKGLIAFIPLFAVILALSIAMRIAGKHALGAGVGMIAIMGALLLLGVAINYITHSLDAKQIKQGIIAVGAMLTMIAILLVLSRATHTVEGEKSNFLQFGAAMLVISLAMLALAGTIKIIGGMDWKQALVGTIAVLTILGMFTLMMKTGSKLQKTAGSLALIAVIIAELIIAISLLSTIPAEQILPAAAAVTMVLIAFSVMLRMMPTAESWSDFAKRAGMAAVGLIALAGVATILGMFAHYSSNVTPKAMLSFATALTEMLLGLAAVTWVISKIKIDKSFFGSAGAFAVLTLLVMGVINGIAGLYQIPGYDEFLKKGMDGVKENFIGIQMCFAILGEVALLLAGLSLITKLLGNGNSNDELSKVEKAFAILTAILVILINAISALYLIPGYDEFIKNGIDGVASNLANISLCMIAVAEMLPILAGLALISKLIPPGAEKTIFTMELALAAMILGLTAIIAIFAGLYQIPGFDNFIQNGYTMLVKLGEVIGYFIGNFLGGIIAGFATTLSSALIVIIDNIGIFAEHLKGVVASLAGISDNGVSLSSISNIADAILKLTASNFLDQISSLIGYSTDYDKMGEALEGFASHIGAFGEIVSGYNFDKDRMEIATEAAKNLAEFINYLPREGGFLQSIIGEAGDLTKFSQGILAFGTAITAFDALMKMHIRTNGPIDEEVLNSTINAGKMLAELQNAIPRTGGWAQQILGESDMKKFAWGNSDGSDPASAKGGIVGFANAICAYDDIIKNHGGIDEDAVAATARMGTMLAELNSAIPDTGGKLQEFLGGKDLEAFSGGEDGKGGIVKFATAICDYDDILAEHGALDENIITTSVRMGELLAKLWSFLPTQGGAIKWFTGQQATLEDFAAGITSLGSGLGSFYESVKGITAPDKFNDAMEGLIYLVTAWNMISGSYAPAIEEGKPIDLTAIGFQALLKSSDEILHGSKLETFKLIGQALLELADYLIPFSEKMAGIDLGSIQLIGEAMMNLGYSLMAASDLDPSAVDNLIASIRSLATMEIDTYKETLSENQAAMHDATQEMYTEALTITENEKQSLFDKVKTNISDIAGGVSSDMMSMLLGAVGSKNNTTSTTIDIIPEFTGGNVAEQFMGNLLGGEGGASQYIQSLFGGLSSSGNMATIASSIGNLFSPTTNTSLMTSLTGGGEDMFASLLSGFSSGMNEEGAFSDVFSQFGNVFDGDIGSEFGNILSGDGNSSIQTYLDGMLSGMSGAEASTDITALVQSLSDGVKSETDIKLPVTGEYAVDGFIRGLTVEKSLKKMRDAGTTLASTVDSAFRSRLKIESPSKVMEQSGQYTVVGFVKGVLESMYMAKDAADKLGISTVDAMSAAVSYAYAAAISDYDFTPTISPVLDLSEVRAGASGLSGLFDLSPQIKMASDNNRMVNEYVSRVQADSAAAFAALNNLKDNMAKVGGRLEDGWQPDLEGAIERGFSNVSVNLDGKKVGKMNVDYQNRQNFLRNTQQVK